MAGDPVGQVSNSHGSVSGLGVVDSELFPDWFNAGADNTTYIATRLVIPGGYRWNV